MPSLREYAACYQIDARRLQPRQLLMHPGPVNRGVELSAEVIDSPQALIADQVASGRGRADGDPLRAARRRVERGAARRAGADRGAAGVNAAGARSPARQLRLDRRPAPPRTLLVRAAQAARPARRPRRASSTCSSATARSPSSAGRARSSAGRARGASTPRGCTLFPAFVDPHVHLRTPGPRGRGGPRVGHARRRGGRLLLRARDAEHRPGGRQRAGAALAAGAGRRARRGPGRLPRRDHARARRAAS